MDDDDGANPTRTAVLVVVRDLLLASKITPVLQARGLGYRWLRDPGGLRQAGPGARWVLVDCHLPDGLEEAGAYKCRSPGTTIVGFASHTDGQTIARARELGVDRVMARSAFFQRLESLLP